MLLIGLENGSSFCLSLDKLGVNRTFREVTRSNKLSIIGGTIQACAGWDTFLEWTWWSRLVPWYNLALAFRHCDSSH